MHSRHPILSSLEPSPAARFGVPRFVFSLAMMLTLSACGASKSDAGSSMVGGSMQVPAGRQPGAVATVNGSIHVDDNAAVTSATTVNGAVHLGGHATATSLNSVNGSITLGSGAHVSGSVSSVNGELSLEDGADVSGSLSNVNGKITLTAAHVGGGITTVSGGMNITGASRVEGGLHVQKPSSELIHLVMDVPRIVIRPGRALQGDLPFDPPAQLFISDKATVGAVTGATAISFNGETPPP